jgi:hypothetical protein
MTFPRKLNFDEYGVMWECLCSYKKEWSNSSVEWPRYSHEMETILAWFPDPRSMHRILSEINYKELTYDEDVLPSITSLLSVLSRPFKGGFLYGLPEWLFDSALGSALTLTFLELCRGGPFGAVDHSRISLD